MRMDAEIKALAIGGRTVVIAALNQSNGDE